MHFRVDEVRGGQIDCNSPLLSGWKSPEYRWEGGRTRQVCRWIQEIHQLRYAVIDKKVGDCTVFGPPKRKAITQPEHRLRRKLPGQTESRPEVVFVFVQAPRQGQKGINAAGLRKLLVFITDTIIDREFRSCSPTVLPIKIVIIRTEAVLPLRIRHIECLGEGVVMLSGVSACI